MKDPSRANQKLLDEISALKQRVEELEKAQAEHLRTEEALRSMINVTNEALLLTDTQGTILMANESLARNLGKSVRELTGTSQYDHFPPEVARRRQLQYDKVTSTGRPVSFEDERAGRSFEIFAYPVLDDKGKVSKIAIFAQDITDRKRAEEALRESEQEFKDLCEKSIAGIYVIQGGVFRYVNVKLAEILGYEVDEMTDKVAMKDAVFPEDWPMVEENIHKRITGELESRHYEFRAVTRNKEIRNIEVYGSRTMYRGRPAVIGTYLDITERKRMEDALRESEEKYRILVEKANEAIIIAQDDVFVFANRKMSDLLGVPAADLEGRPFIDYIWPEDRELVTMTYKKRMAGQTIFDAYDFRFTGPEGRPIWVFLSAAAIQWKGRPATLNMMTDITDRKRTEEALRESEQKFKDLCEKSIAGIYLIQDGVFRYVNMRLAENLGYEVDELTDKVAVKDIVFPDDWPSVEESMLKRISGEMDSLHYEFRVNTKNKGVRDVEVYSTRTMYRGKTAIIGTYLDITGLKRAEEEKRHSERLSVALEMAGAICHELNQPLQVISGRIDILSMVSQDDRTRKALEIMSDQVLRMGTITRKLMGLKKYSNREYLGAIKITDLDDTPDGNDP